jgi:Ca2+-binding EF-hand superfamily protein
MNSANNILTATLALALLTLLVHVAPAAADEPVTFGTGGYASAMHTKEMMHKMDTNGDNMVSKDEWTAFQERAFAALDKDNSGFITEAELMATPDDQFAFATAAYARGMKTHEMFMKLDANGDGKVTREEFLAFHRKVFDMMDKQKKGKIGLVDFIRPGGV